MSCSIGTLIGSECGTTSSKLNITRETIPISLCQKDVSKHLHTISVTDISTEYDLILARAGVFEYDEEYTRGGGGVLPEKLGRGVRPASQKPYPIYDENLQYSLPYL